MRRTNPQPQPHATKVAADPVWLAYRSQPSVALRNQLVERYLSIVRYHAARLHARIGDVVDVEDLYSAGVDGLMQAIEAFDLSRNIKFETYCVQRVAGAMLDSLRQWDWVPRNVRSAARRLSTVQEQLRCELGRYPTVDEMARRMNMTVEAFERFARQADTLQSISLSKQWAETDSLREVREIDVLSDQKARAPERRQVDLDGLRRLCVGLSDRERLIIVCYYYLGDTMKEVGQQLGLSESRVSQMHSAMIARIGDRLKAQRSAA